MFKFLKYFTLKIKTWEILKFKLPHKVLEFLGNGPWRALKNPLISSGKGENPVNVKEQSATDRKCLTRSANFVQLASLLGIKAELMECQWEVGSPYFLKYIVILPKGILLLEFSIFPPLPALFQTHCAEK